MTRSCDQTAVYWAPSGFSTYGLRTYVDPVEISVRWQYARELIRDSQGKEIVSGAQVFTTQDVKESGLLFLGELTDLDSSEEADPMSVDSDVAIYEIVKFEKSPALSDATQFVRKAYL